MSEATITSQGQIIIAADIWRSLGQSARDRLRFTPTPDGTAVLLARRRSINDQRCVQPAPTRDRPAGGGAEHEPVRRLMPALNTNALLRWLTNEGSRAVV